MRAVVVQATTLKSRVLTYWPINSFLLMSSSIKISTKGSTTPFTTQVTAEGPHSLVMTATDIAGNVGTGTTLSWTMDFTAPIW